MSDILFEKEISQYKNYIEDNYITPSKNLSDFDAYIVFSSISQIIAFTEGIEVLIKNRCIACLGPLERCLMESLASVVYAIDYCGSDTQKQTELINNFKEKKRLGFFDAKKSKWNKVEFRELCATYDRCTNTPNSYKAFSALSQLTHFSECIPYNIISDCGDGWTKITFGNNHQDSNEIIDRCITLTKSLLSTTFKYLSSAKY